MKKLSIFLLAAILSSGCQKENKSPNSTGTSLQPGGSHSQQNQTPSLTDGTYSGLFEYESAVNHPGHLAGTVLLTITGINFNSGTPAYLGFGTYEVNSGSIQFSPGEVLPAIEPFISSELVGGYSYTVKGDSLLLNKTEYNGTFTYKLKRQ
jgi:hypothetical protein